MTSQAQLDSPRPAPLGPGHPDYDALMSEYRYYLSMKNELCDRPDLRAKYISIYRHKIVDTGTDQLELGRRAARQYPGEVVLIIKVERDLPIVELPSIEIR